ncbi:MAG: LD-carboxypeptidase [Acidobacteria bacterium]|nr:LD-carboxypeptidase [Acidobacteriota bacterium]
MDRRSFLGLGMASAFAQQQQQPQANIVKPKTLKPGDSVALITPSTFITDPDLLVKISQTIEYFGLKPVLGKNVGKKWGYAGGTIAERVADLHWAFGDPSIKGVFCMRGGYAAGQLLADIDYGIIRRNPKVFIGYSDITALHLAIHRNTGLVTFHGPVPTSAFTPYTQDFYKRALFSGQPLGALTNPKEANTLRPQHRLRTVRGGKARGRLIGGNLSLILATMGTPFEIDTRDKILFIEDVDEQPYQIDRMLTNLRLAGKLQAAAGIVWGECEDCKPKDYKPSFVEGNFALGEVVDNIFGGLKTPVLSGLTIGHTSDQLTLPIGAVATLDADAGTLTVEESATVS